MIAEIIQLPINIEKLKDELMNQIKLFPPADRGGIVDGWSLQSTNESYTDGWDWEFCPYNGPKNQSPAFVPKNEKQSRLRTVQDYSKFTEIQSEYIKEVFRILNDFDLNPRKARVIRLKSGQVSKWHRDGVEDFYQVRLHIPIQTNPECFFESKLGKVHMEFGKIYLVHINNEHRIMNHGKSDRFHFVCHVWDQKSLSQFHRYDPDLNKGPSFIPAELA